MVKPKIRTIKLFPYLFINPLQHNIIVAAANSSYLKSCIQFLKVQKNTNQKLNLMVMGDLFIVMAIAI